MQVDEMSIIMKYKQVVSQVRNVKQQRAKRKPIANTSNLFEVRATALHPRLHHYEGFSLNPQREFLHRNLYTQGDYEWSTQDRSTQLQQILPLHKRNLNTMEYKSLGDQKTTNSLLQLLIEWSMILGSRSKVRENFQQ